LRQIFGEILGDHQNAMRMEAPAKWEKYRTSFEIWL
jgi:hypothetical protein